MATEEIDAEEIDAEEIDAAVLESLAAKVNSLNLNEQEDAVLQVVLARAAAANAADDAEVAGFGMALDGATAFKRSGDLQLTPNAAGWGRAMGFHIHINPNHYIGETEKNLDRS